MLRPQIPYHILLRVESQERFDLLAQQLLAEFHLQNQAQCQTWEDLLTSIWLRRRYERVRDTLYAEKNALSATDKTAPGRASRLEYLNRSIQTFHKEVERQKKCIADCRRLLRRIQHVNLLSPCDQFPRAA